MAYPTLGSRNQSCGFHGIPQGPVVQGDGHSAPEHRGEGRWPKSEKATCEHVDGAAQGLRVTTFMHGVSLYSGIELLTF